MEKEFTTYTQALALKELGFDEPCFGSYVRGNEYKDWTLYFKGGTFFAKDYPEFITVPLYQQTFRWFREKHNLCGEVYTVNMGAIDYTFQIRDLYSEDIKHNNFEANTGGYIGTFLTYEEAESVCLDKLIEIIKNK